MHKGSLIQKLQKKKFRNKELSDCNSQLIFGLSGIKLCKKGIITSYQLFAAKKILAKALKGLAKVWIRFLPQRPITKKPLEMRMGKGKGSVFDWICEVKAGMILFEISEVIFTKELQKYLKIAIQKLPIQVKFIHKLL